jgi:hypothetical protein
VYKVYKVCKAMQDHKVPQALKVHKVHRVHKVPQVHKVIQALKVPQVHKDCKAQQVHKALCQALQVQQVVVLVQLLI